MLVLAVARAHGVKKIIMFDIDAARAQFAETYGADKAVPIHPPFSGSLVDDAPAFAQQYARGTLAAHGIRHGFDVVVEATGAAICVQLGIAMLKFGGTLIQAGLGKPLTPVPLFALTANELTIKGT